MANIKSAKKRILVNAKRNDINRSRKSEIKTYIKKFEVAINANNYESAKELLSLIQKKLNRASTKSTLHSNTAARKVSRLTKRLNTIA
ncbi:MAG: 30S ribosomal protein S20 [Eubacteriales bacterium]|nr:30S ribosomal protein S20 [Eubacteriales bacterium]